MTLRSFGWTPAIFDVVNAPAPSPRITRLEALPKRPERLRIHLDDGSVLEAGRDTVADLGLSVDDPLDERLRAEVEDADLRWRAREAALRLLSHRARSRSELAGRLRRKDFPGRIVASCLDGLAEEGLVDDAEFARAFVRDRLRLKPRGRTALVVELRKKGVKERIAETAVDEVFEEEGVREEELAVRTALGWLRRQSAKQQRSLVAERFSDERERARRRLHGYLRRRGFGGQVLVRAVEAAESKARSLS